MYREDKLNEILERFPHMYNIDIGSNNEFLVSSIYEEVRNLNQSIYDLSKVINIENANGIWLDYWCMAELATGCWPFTCSY